MATSQIKLLNTLAKEIKREKRDKAQIMKTLMSAKILTKDEKFTRAYSNLKKVVAE